MQPRRFLWSTRCSDSTIISHVRIFEVQTTSKPGVEPRSSILPTYEARSMSNHAEGEPLVVQSNPQPTLTADESKHDKSALTDRATASLCRLKKIWEHRKQNEPPSRPKTLPQPSQARLETSLFEKPLDLSQGVRDLEK